jgi:capsular polysaccharide transport system permease protein
VIGACFGIIIAVISEFIPAMTYVANGIRRVLFFTSGVFFHAQELPAELRNVLMINPIFHCLELMRQGFFPHYDSHYASVSYVIAWIIGFIFLALAMERTNRGRMLEA